MTGRSITAGRTFAVWTGDWTASRQDDLDLIPNVHGNVFQNAFDALDQQLSRAG